MEEKSQSFKGYILAIISYMIWGILPLYWKQLQACTPMEILANRIIGSFIFLSFIVWFAKKKGFFDYLKIKKTRYALIMTGILLTLNWFVFIVAVNSNQVVQASLGYYINPLISVLLGMIVLKEKINKLQIVALILAFVGVAYMTLSYGVFPWISIILAMSFATYGLLKKVYALDSILSLLGEVLILLPIISTYWVYLWIVGENHFIIGDLKTILYIAFSGVVTVIPLYFFSEGTKRIPLSSIGFLQYITPTMMLLIGVLVYGEAFTLAHKVSFAFIWIALILYAVSIIKGRKPKVVRYSIEEGLYKKEVKE